MNIMMQGNIATLQPMIIVRDFDCGQVKYFEDVSTMV
jgi:hypothetical protein